MNRVIFEFLGIRWDIANFLYHFTNNESRTCSIASNNVLPKYLFDPQQTTTASNKLITMKFFKFVQAVNKENNILRHSCQKFLESFDT